MTGSFILDYYLLVFVASCGVFQIAAALEGLRGMLIFKYRPGSFLVGLALVAASFTWFFLSEPRNVPDSAHGMNGNEQFAYLFAGLGSGLAFTLVVASLRNWTLGSRATVTSLGLDVLRESSYASALRRASELWWPLGRRTAKSNSGNPVTEPTSRFTNIRRRIGGGLRSLGKALAASKRGRLLRQWRHSWR